MNVIPLNIHLDDWVTTKRHLCGPKHTHRSGACEWCVLLILTISGSELTRARLNEHARDGDISLGRGLAWVTWALGMNRPGCLHARLFNWMMTPNVIVGYRQERPGMSDFGRMGKEHPLGARTPGKEENEKNLSSSLPLFILGHWPRFGEKLFPSNGNLPLYGVPWKKTPQISTESDGDHLQFGGNTLPHKYWRIKK